MFQSRRASMRSDVFRDELSLAFDGSNDYVNCGTSLGTTLGDNYSGSLAVSIWFNTDTTSGNDGLFYIGDFGGNNGEFNINIASNKIKFRLDNNAWAREVAFTSTGSWHHLVCVYDTSGENASLMYLDGASVGSIVGGGDFPDDADMDFNGLKTIIGAYYNTSYPFDGKISDIAVYNKSLSASEVATIYNGREPYNHKEGVASSNLKAWWRMGDGTLDTNGLIGDEVNPTYGANAIETKTANLGSFDTDTTGDWTVNGSVAYNSGTGDATITHDGGGTWWMRLTSTLAVGRVYRVTLKAKVNAAGAEDSRYLFITDGEGTEQVSTAIKNPLLTESYQDYEFFVMATSTTFDISSEANTDTDFDGSTPDSGDALTVDDIKAVVVNGNAGTMFEMASSNLQGDTP